LQPNSTRSKKFWSLSSAPAPLLHLLLLLLVMMMTVCLPASSIQFYCVDVNAVPSALVKRAGVTVSVFLFLLLFNDSSQNLLVENN
jgi:hypothetical protein